MGVRLEAPSPRHWATSEVAQPEALAYWVDTVCDQFLELEIDTPVRDRFHASLDQVNLGPATANFLEADIQQVRRTRDKIAHMHTPMFTLMHLRVGQVQFRQMGRQVHVGPGECVLIDCTEPYELECPHPTRAMALQLPVDWLKRWVAQPERHATQLFHANAGGWSSALCAAVASLDINSCDNHALPPDEIAEPIATLLKLAVGPEPHAAVQRPVLFDQL